MIKSLSIIWPLTTSDYECTLFRTQSFLAKPLKGLQRNWTKISLSCSLDKTIFFLTNTKTKDFLRCCVRSYCNSFVSFPSS